MVTEWEQACCGAAFRVGEDVTWNLLAHDPAVLPQDGLARFLEEHHDLASEDVQQWGVTGRVHRIRAVAYPELPVIGEKGSFVLDRERPAYTDLCGVEEGVSSDVSEYLVELEIAEGQTLPTFVSTPSLLADQAAAAEATARNRERMADPIGEILESTAGYARTICGTDARFAQDGERSAVTIVPVREEATEVRWARSDHDEDGIGVHTGEGSWWFPATVEHAHLVRVFLDAAAQGRVVERVVDLGGTSRRLDTVVTASDGRTWTASTSVEPVELEDGTMVVFGNVWERVQRGPRVYRAWRG